MVTPDDGPLPPPLPVRVRPAAGETAESYIRRLAQANHLRPSLLQVYVRNPDVPAAAIRLRRLAAASGSTRTALAFALTGLTPATRPDRLALGNVAALVMCHCESVDSGLLDTTTESFDRHFAVNARASWLLIREFGRRFRGPHGTGRIISLTSDATVGNLPYGASKAALDRITLAAAHELAHLGVTANAIHPARSTQDG